jgi:hypothetical protein
MGAAAKSSENSPYGSFDAASGILLFRKTALEDGTCGPMTMEDGDGISGASSIRDFVENKGMPENKTFSSDQSENGQRPPLPPRPKIVPSSERPVTPLGHFTSPTKKPQMQSQATTALSPMDIQTLSFPDGTRGTFSTSDNSTPPSISGSRKVSQNGSEIDDNASLMSYAPTLRAAGDLNSLLGESSNAQSPAWKLLSAQAELMNPFETVEYNQHDCLSTFEHEFDEIPDADSKGGNEG